MKLQLPFSLWKKTHGIHSSTQTERMQTAHHCFREELPRSQEMRWDGVTEHSGTEPSLLWHSIGLWATARGPVHFLPASQCWYPGQGTTTAEMRPRTAVQERMTPKLQGCFLTSQVPILARLEHSHRMDEASSSQTPRGQNFTHSYSPNSRPSVIFNGRGG